MKKDLNKGFVLVETLIVTTFVSGVLVYLFIQFSNLSQNYKDAYKYNTVENLYSLRNIRNFIEKDTLAFNTIESLIGDDKMTEITTCQYFTDKEYCMKLLELENIKRIFITTNEFNKDLFFNHNEGFKKFVNKIKSQGTHKYRILAEFKDSTYATIRFGE